MAPHSSTLAWKIPWTEEPGGLQSMGSLRVGHDWATSLSLFTFMHWRRKWQLTPVFLPGESQGWEPGGLPSMGSHRVGHAWSDLAALFPYWLPLHLYYPTTFTPWLLRSFSLSLSAVDITLQADDLHFPLQPPPGPSISTPHLHSIYPFESSSLTTLLLLLLSCFSCVWLSAPP